MKTFILVVGCTLTLVGGIAFFDYCLGRVIGTLERRDR